jgi:MoxR-like ATPase
MRVKEKITKLIEALSKGVYERERELKLALLSSIAGESIFLLGPPGVAKSLVARKLKYAYKDARVFEYLMSRFSTPDEIFGPVSISKLKNEDKYERIVDRYLPASEVVFLDEIWKSGPSIQNSLLTVINEKVFRNGDVEIKVPMKALISASNELPAKDQGLEALWDRFLVRLVVLGIDDKTNFNKMISEELNAYEDSVDDSGKITDEEYMAWSEKINKITVPENVFNVIHYIRNYIADYNGNKEAEEQIYVSDRRWRKIVRLLRASAFLNDRAEVDLMDCFLIRHCIWNESEQQDTVYGFVRDAIEKHGYTVNLDFKGIREKLDEFKKEIDGETRFAGNGERRKKPRIPNEYMKHAWDDEVAAFLREVANMRKMMERYRGKDPKHLRANLFVNPNLADTVESHVNATIKNIEKIELKIREIENYYKKLEDGVIEVIDDGETLDEL